MAGDPAKLPYRPCVGIVLVNAQGLVWVGRRVSKWEGDRSEHMWQMPQGGIDPGESVEQAAKRELAEVIGTDKAVAVAESTDWLHYDLPPEAMGVALEGRYRGQRQKWLLMRFTGRDEDIDIAGKAGQKAEFDAWRWVPLAAVPDLVVPFKRPVYRALVREFSTLLAPSHGAGAREADA